MKFSLGIIIFIVLIKLPMNALGLENELQADIEAYCHYIEAKNGAKNTSLLAPEVIVRAQNTNEDFPYQNNLITAFSKDLADLSKSKQIRTLIGDECTYYRLSQEANLQILYAIPNLQKQALQYKLTKIEEAKDQLKGLIKGVRAKLSQHNDTLSNLYKLENYEQKLTDLQSDIEANLAVLGSSNIKTVPLKQLARDIKAADSKRQQTLNKIEKLNNWSIQVQAGAQQNSSSFIKNQDMQAYGAVFLRYNLGSMKSNHKIDSSLHYYMEWKNRQVDGRINKLYRLIQSIDLLKKTQIKRLLKLEANYRKYNQLSKKLGSIDSTKANEFKQQIELDRIIRTIEINYLKYFIGSLEKVGKN